MTDKAGNDRREGLIELGQRIRSARQAIHLAQSELGKRAGLSRDTISRLERGAPVDTPTLLKVLTALGYSLELQRTQLRAADMRREYAHIHEDSAS